jgi:uncharacterized protein YndB with AHSA1/START domain
MGALRYSIWVDTAPEAVWSVWTDLDLIPRWQTGSPRVADVIGDGGVGTFYSVRRGPTSARTTIIVAEAPSRYVSRTHALLGLRFDLEARLTPERGGTYLALEARTEWPRGLRWFGRVVEAFVLSPREAERELANLKAIVEADRPAPAQGRQSTAAGDLGERLPEPEGMAQTDE